MRFWLAAFLSIIFSGSLNAAPPVIESASLSGDTVVITGSDFGAKAVATPFKFMPFTNRQHRQTYSQVGFDFVGGNNAVDSNNYSDTSDGVGGGSWLHIGRGGGAESFSHFGHLLPNVNEVYASCWMKFTRRTPLGAGGYGQIKVMRSGIRRGLRPVEDMYYANPKIYPSLFDRLEDPNDLSGPNTDWTVASGLGPNGQPGPAGTIHPQGLYDVPITDGGWHFCEVFYRFNDLGQANGIIQIRFNGTLHVNVSNAQPRTTTGEFFGYMQYSPGLAQEFAQSVWEARFSRIYLDTTRARVFLGNAATLASTTRRFLLAPTAWGGGAITAGAASRIPAGYNWVYVSNAGGEINPQGFAFTASAPPIAPPVVASCAPDTSVAVRSDTARYQVITRAHIRTITTCEPVSRTDTTVARDTVSQ